MTDEPGAQYGAPLHDLPYYLGITFPKPFLSFGLDKSEEEFALEECKRFQYI
jgi:hypothetical protein